MAISVRYPFSGTFQVTQTSTGTFSHTDKPNNAVDPDYWVAAYDFNLSEGTPVLSMAPGIIIDYRQGGEPSHGLGSFVTILHNPGTSDQFYATYAHLSAGSILFQSSDRGVTEVAAGQRLGLSGDTGVGTGPHLHVQYSTTSFTHHSGDVLAYATDSHDFLITFNGSLPSLGQTVTGALEYIAGTANELPVVTVANQTVGTFEWRKLNDVASVSDPDGDTVTHYQLWDSTGEGNWWADGGIVDASAGYWTSDLDNVWFRGDSTAGTQTLWVRGWDGTEAGEWDSFQLLTESPNQLPVVTVADQTVDTFEWRKLNDVASVSDPDGDTVTHYQLFDNSGESNWWADGGIVDASAGYWTSDLDNVWFRGDSTAGTQTLWVRGWDGTEAGEWDSFQFITESPNQLPVVTVADQTVDTFEWRKLNNFASVSDPDGDTVTHYQLFDNSGESNWWADGGIVDASAGYWTSDLDNVWFQGDAIAGTQTLWVRGWDGIEAGAWDSFELFTV